MMKHRQTHYAHNLFVFLLLGVFALLATMMVAFSAKIYQDTVTQTNAHNETRVLYSYVMNMVHANEAAGAITIREESGIPVLAMSWRDEEGQTGYETLLYCKDGTLCELLHENGEAFDASLGEEICPTETFVPTIEGSMLKITVSADEPPIWIALHGGEVRE